MKGTLRPKTKNNKLVIDNFKPKVLKCKQNLQPLNHLLQFSGFPEKQQKKPLQNLTTKIDQQKTQQKSFQDSQMVPQKKKGRNNMGTSIYKSFLSKSKSQSQPPFKISNPYKKITIKTTNTQVQIVQNLKPLEIKDDYQLLVEQIVQMLREKYIITKNHNNSINVKKENFVSLIHYLTSFLSAKQKLKQEEAHQQHQSISFIREPLNKLAELVRKQQLKQQQQCCNLQSQTSQFNYRRIDFQTEFQQLNSQLIKISQEKLNCSKHIQSIIKQSNYLINEVKVNKVVIENQLRLKMDLQASIKEYEQQYAKLYREVTSLKEQANTLKTQSQKIANFIHDQQNNKIIKIIGEQYKKIQADIYQYAVYLQSNLLASSLQYQPHPFTAIERLMDQEMKTVNKSLIQNKEMSIEDKSKKMRDFVLSSMDHFKKKDEQMIKLTDFKTKCIKQFISNMQKWVQNWSFKQEYLVKSRNQFALDFSKTTEKISTLKNLQSCQQCKPSIMELTLQLQKLFIKIQDNYKFGNSFY